VFLNPGTCFGRLYNWKIKFLPISVEETLLAVAPKVEVTKIPMLLEFERCAMLKELKTSDILLFSVPDTLQEASKTFTLNLVPCGTFLIREGETPKALFYIMKGIVKKVIYKQNTIIEVKRYSEGQYCPKKLDQPLTYDLITESLCEIIVIPKKGLKMMGSPLVAGGREPMAAINMEEELARKREWQRLKENMMAEFSTKVALNYPKSGKRWK
jgi:hypothetical protein